MSNFSVNFQDYPYSAPLTEGQVREVVEQIVFARKDDIMIIKNLPNVFLQGRTVGRAPSSSADVIAGDRVGDVSFATSGGNQYLFVLMDISGTAEWRRVQLSSF